MLFITIPSQPHMVMGLPIARENHLIPGTCNTRDEWTILTYRNSYIIQIEEYYSLYPSHLKGKQKTILQADCSSYRTNPKEVNTCLHNW